MTYNEMLSIMLAKLPDAYEKSPGYPVYDIVSACALAAIEITDEIDTAKQKLYLDNLTGSELDAYVYDRTALERRDGDFAYGYVTVYGTGTIPAGTMFATESGLFYTANSDVTVSELGHVDITAAGMGTDYNAPANSITKFAVTIQGFTSVTNPEAITGGADRESDDDYRERYREKMSKPPINGNVYAYRDWALDVDGVGGVRVTPLGHGAGTVDVIIVNASGAEPSADLIKAVQDYIDPGSTGKGEGVAPIGAVCYVSAATFTSYDVSIKVILDGAASQSETDAALQKAIGEVFATGFTSGCVRYSELAEAIIHTAGVKYFSSLSVGGAYQDITLENNGAAKLGKWEATYDYS